MKEEKRNKIKESLMKTKLKRQFQKCFTIELKLKHKKLSKTDFMKLKFLFTQCKWLYNYLINLQKEELFNFDTKIKKIYSFDKDGNKIERELTLPSQIKQTVYQTLLNNIKALSEAKKRGRKVGKLKFKSDYDSIDLKQYGNSHEIRGNLLKLSGFKRLFKVFGLEQLNELTDVEFANAKLVKKQSGFYIILTCYKNLTLKNLNQSNQQKVDVGLDFGIKDNIITSDGEKFNCKVEETDHLKNLQRKLTRQKKGSNNYYKTRLKIRREYEKMSNVKQDKTNKLISYLCKKYSTVYLQDEMIKSWHSGWYGKRVQHSFLGKVKAKLKEQPNVQIIARWYPTTKMCYNCGEIHSEIGLDDREFICPSCGFKEDRDIKAAKTVLYIGQVKNNHTGMDCIRTSNVERVSDFIASYEAAKHSSVKHGS